mmetsp:Transcript_24177/g.67271  ORF Transcript_24177/g.67271 Transcript_24177/m.67271 type:complete len:82 (-) Transcript_24177:213-458(-)
MRERQEAVVATRNRFIHQNRTSARDEIPSILENSFLHRNVDRQITFITRFGTAFEKARGRLQQKAIRKSILKAFIFGIFFI